ncbi:hypothetical protein CgunFtcFv8_002927 [Champsocephalus gunnari]|uniref:Uncharacterized protein n=1 Tax=Champsocephalus gunnari TaxID=52237 RepID=A0AAN8HJ07_CHAGU|nr:hypothetical protein CgunFtcFv8_002927 [Champsocephalus gunnari]
MVLAVQGLVPLEGLEEDRQEELELARAWDLALGLVMAQVVLELDLEERAMGPAALGLAEVEQEQDLEEC